MSTCHRLALSSYVNLRPIHRSLAGSHAWEVVATGARRDVARLRATTIVDAPAFPFPHLLEVAVALHDDRLVVDTTLIPTGDRKVPAAWGWHPYLRVPGTPRSRWSLRLPAREHLMLDERGIPSGASSREPAEDDVVGRRTFDDLYRL